MSDDFDIGDTATSFNDATQFGLDDTAAAAESGITVDNSYDFAQGPDGNLGSAIPGAGGDLNNNGWYTVDYNQPAEGIDTQSPIADGAGAIDVNADGSDLAALQNDQVAAFNPAASDTTGFQGQTDEFGGISNVAPEPVFNPRDGTFSIPIPTVSAGAVDRFLTGLSYQTNSLINILPASLTTTVKDLTASLKSAFTAITTGAAPVSPNVPSGARFQTDENGLPISSPAPLSRVVDGQGLPIETGTPGVFVNVPAPQAPLDQTAAESARLGLTSPTPLNPAADPSQFPAFDDDGNLQPGFAINEETGEPFYRGFGPNVAAPVSGVTGVPGAAADFVGPPISAANPLSLFQANLTKAKAAFAEAGIPFPSVFNANPVTAVLAALNNNNGGNAASTTAAVAGSILPTAFSPTAVGAGTATAAVLNAALDAAINASIAGLTPDQVQAAAATAAAAEAYTLKLAAQAQQVREAQTKQTNNGDWRVRLSLAPGADYLYNATPSGILAPLQNTGGVIFPYTPKITTNYTAMYAQTDLTHSNYKGYYYQNSNVGEISIEAKFTAQDTNEAQYLLAVIHFFRSVTKMFYGQDAQRGAPPPLVFLSGFGEYQFNRHPCVVSGFTYNMPDNVDYIRARSVNINGASLLTRRDRQTSPTDPISGAAQRIANLVSSQGISPGAIVTRPAPPTLGQNNPTYVPTSVDLSIRLLPMQSRRQVSQQFSLKGFANGDLIKGGFW
jgi:hypothetical protein